MWGGGRLLSVRLFAPGLLVFVLIGVGLMPALAGATDRSQRVLPGVVLLGYELGNLHQDEVPAAIRAAFADFAGQPLYMRFDDDAYQSTPEEAGVSLDINETAARIAAVGQQDSFLDWLGHLIGRHPERIVSPVLNIDERQLNALLDSLAAEVDRPARSAVLSITPAGPVLQPALTGRRLDRAGTEQRLREHLGSAEQGILKGLVVPAPPSVGDSDWAEAADLASRITSGPVRLRYNQSTWQVTAADLARFITPQPPESGQRSAVRWDDAAVAAALALIAAEVDIQPAAAQVERRDNGFVIVSGSEGLKVDVGATASALRAAAVSPDREAPVAVVVIPPPLDTRDWQEAVDLANRAAGSPIRLVYKDRSWNLSPSAIAGMLAFTRTQDSPTRHTVALDGEQLDSFLRDIAKQVARPPREPRAKLDKGKLTLAAPGEDGLSLDVAATASAVSRSVFTDIRTVPAVIAEVKPKMTPTDLDKLELPDLIVDASTSYAGSFAERAHNVELAAARLDGTLVAPGATFSFNQAVGPTTLGAGFKLGYGITIKDNQAVTVPSEGGGICQVATTLFHAAFWAGLPIVERQGHIYWISRYGTPPRGMLGLDATVEDPYLDFKFRNNTDDWLLVAASADGANLRFALHGKTPDWQVKVDPTVISNVVKASQTMVRQEDPTMPAGSELWVEHAEDGFLARIRRTVTAGGNVIESRDFVSSYRPAQNVLLVGTKPSAVTPGPTLTPSAVPGAPTPTPAGVAPTTTPTPPAGNR